MRKLLGLLFVGVFAMVSRGATNITANVTLDADADWREAGPVTVAAGVTVDLNGHDLKVAGLSGEGQLVDSAFQASVAVPAVIASQAMFWLDAADTSTLTMTAAGVVSAWRSKVGSRVATLQQTDVAPLYSATGFQLPCVDFGTYGSKKSLSFDRFANIRTMFAVMKLQKSVYVAPLTDRATYDFYRGGSGQYLHSTHSAQNASHVWNGTQEVNPSADVIPDDAFQVLCYEMAIDAHADTLAMDRPSMGGVQTTSYNGGKQISELILFDAVLPEADRLAVVQYLQRKWWPRRGEVHLDLSGSAAAAYNGQSIAIDDSVALVLNDTQMGAPCDLRGFGTVRVDGTVEMNNHELRVDGLSGQGTVTSQMSGSVVEAVEPWAAPAIVQTSAMFWLDAADKTTLTVDANGNVSAWRSKVGDRVATLQQTDVAPVYSETEFIQPCVDCGSYGSKQSLSYDRFSNIRTVFAVMKIQKSLFVSLLTDRTTYDFFRGGNAGSTEGQYLHSTHSAKNASHVWNGLQEVNAAADVIPEDDFQILCYEMAIDAHSDTLAMDRPSLGGNQTAYYNGGKQISELILFDSILSESDRKAVTLYLKHKWEAYRMAGAPLRVNVPAGQTLENTVALKGRLKLVKEGEGTFLAKAKGQTYQGGTIVESGCFVVEGTGADRVLGAPGGSLTIQPTASFDLNGMYDFTDNQLVLSGGRAYSSIDYQWGHGIFSDVVLTDDSEASLLHMLARAYWETTLDLRGNTLKVTGEGSSYLFGNVTATSGRILVDDGTRVVFDKTGIRAPETTFELNGPMTVNVPSDVGDLLLSCPNAGYLGDEVVKVHGTFAPLAGTFPNVQMLDQSVLDVSSRTTPLSCVSVEGDTTFTCSFADNAVITVQIGSRRLQNGDYLVSWETPPPPGTAFKLPAGMRGALIVGEKGLYYFGGLLVIVR